MKLKYIAALVGALIISAESQAWTWSDLPVIDYGNRVYTSANSQWKSETNKTGLESVWAMVAVMTAFDVTFGRNIASTVAGNAMDNLTQRLGVRGSWNNFKQTVAYYDRQLLQLPYYMGTAWQYVGRPLAKAAVVFSAFRLGSSWVVAPVQGAIKGFFKKENGQSQSNNYYTLQNLLTITTIPYTTLQTVNR